MSFEKEGGGADKCVSASRQARSATRGRVQSEVEEAQATPSARGDKKGRRFSIGTQRGVYFRDIYIEGYVAWHLFSGLYIEGIDRSKRGSCSFRKGAMLGR